MALFQLNLFDRVTALQSKLRGNPTKKRTAPPDISDPILESIWQNLSATYFPLHPQLAKYKIVWSQRRQKRVLASCNIRQRIVKVAQELRDPKHHEILDPLIFHEMCHAVLETDIDRKGRKRLWHGPKFKLLEKRHPKTAELDRWIKSGGWLSAVRSHRGRNNRKRNTKSSRHTAY